MRACGPALDPEDVGVRNVDDFDRGNNEHEGDDDIPDESERGPVDPGPEDFSGPLGPPDTIWRRYLGLTGGHTPVPRAVPPPHGTPLAIPRPPLGSASDPADEDELRGTSPIEPNSGPNSGPRPGEPGSPGEPSSSGEHTLFADRYHGGAYSRRSGTPEPREPQQPSAPPPPDAAAPAGIRPSAVPRRTGGPAEDHFGLMLQRRRAEDERLSGRRWPGGGQAYPADPYEVQYFQQLAIALGEVDPQVLAREAVLRYVRASRIGGEDHLAPTDIFAILHFGLGLTLRPLNCTGLPHVLAVYHRATREVYLDWQLIQDPPYGRAVLDPAAWRRAVDTSPVARFLLGWACAVHLTDNYDIPLVLGFSPAPALVAGAPTLSADTQNRYRRAIAATASLLAPAERLWQQITTNRFRIHMGDPDWREHMRAEYGYGQQERRTSGGPATQPDPAAQLVEMLAEMNNCPPVLIEAQLDGDARRLEWSTFSLRLLHEIPVLQMRYGASARMFALAASNPPSWGGPAPSTSSNSVPVMLSL